jgi:hypothetical protein
MRLSLSPHPQLSVIARKRQTNAGLTLTGKRLTNYTASGGNEKVAHALSLEP